MTAKYQFISNPREMFPCTKKRNVFNGTRVQHTDQSKFVHQSRPQRFVSKSPVKDVCTQDLQIEMKTLVCWTPPGISCP